MTKKMKTHLNDFLKSKRNYQYNKIIYNFLLMIKKQE